MFTLLTTRWRQITTFILFKNCHSKSSRDYGSQVAARYAPMNPRVVESVVTQLQGGLFGKCLRTVVSVSNYTVEVRTQRITEQIFYCNCFILGKTSHTEKTDENDNQIHLGAGAP